MDQACGGILCELAILLCRTVSKACSGILVCCLTDSLIWLIEYIKQLLIFKVAFIHRLQSNDNILSFDGITQ